MGLKLAINIKTMSGAGAGPDDVRAYIASLQTQKVMFLNGPESPGPCLRCLQYHRTVWKKNDPSRPRPLLHPHCYCRVVSYHEAASNVPQTQYRNEFLQSKIAKMSLQKRVTLMGAGMARLHRLGIIETNNLVTANGVATLGETLARFGLTKQQFATISDGDLLKLVAVKPG